MPPRLGTVRAAAKSQATHGLGTPGFQMRAEWSGTPYLGFSIQWVPCVTRVLQAPPSSMLPSCTAQISGHTYHHAVQERGCEEPNRK